MLVSSSEGFAREGLFAAILLMALIVACGYRCRGWLEVRDRNSIIRVGFRECALVGSEEKETDFTPSRLAVGPQLRGLNVSLS